MVMFKPLDTIAQIQSVLLYKILFLSSFKNLYERQGGRESDREERRRKRKTEERRRRGSWKR